MNKHQIVIGTFVLLSLVELGLFINERNKFSELEIQSRQTINKLVVAKQASDNAAAKLKNDFDALTRKSQMLKMELQSQGLDLMNSQALCEKQAKQYDKLLMDYDQALDVATQCQQIANRYAKMSRDILDVWKIQVGE